MLKPAIASADLADLLGPLSEPCLISTVDRLRSSNCNSDFIDGLPSWVVVERQEYDLPKRVMLAIESLLQILKQ